MNPDGTITLPPITPAQPVVLCDAPFLTTLAQVEREIAHLEIKDGPSAQAAANLQTRLTKAGAALEAARKKVKDPFLAKCREIDDAARHPAQRIEHAKNELKKGLVAYDDQVRRAAAEAERARQAELARLEKIRRDEEEARIKAEREAAEKARATAPAAAELEVETIDFGGEPDPLLKTETEKAIEAVRFAAPVAVEKPAGVAFRSRLVIASIDVKKLPEVFVVRTANEAGLRSTFCTGWKEGDPVPECDGVVFKVDRQPVSTGRSGF